MDQIFDIEVENPKDGSRGCRGCDGYCDNAGCSKSCDTSCYQTCDGECYGLAK